MKLEKLVGERFKERPADCVIDSHAIMVKGGYIKYMANGIYSSYLPLRRIVRKIEQILREEMDKIDGQEVQFPVVMPASLWDESGRYNSIGDELLLLGPGALPRTQRPAREDEVQQEQQAQSAQAHSGEHEGERAPAVGSTSVGEGHHEVGAGFMLGEVQPDVGQVSPGLGGADDFGYGAHEERLGHGGSRAIR